MKEQLALQKILKDRLAEAQLSNPRYSLRAFSKKVGIHFATLSAIMNGRRLVSRKIATRIADQLDLDPQQRAELLDLFPEPKSQLKNLLVTGEPKPPNYIQFNEQQTALSMEWEFHAVLSLLQCVEFQSNAVWIANRLNISENRAQSVLDRLVETGLIFLNSSGQFERSKENYRTADDVNGTVLKKAHEQTLELAKASLHRDPLDRRDFSFVTVAVNPDQLKLAKQLIRKFQDDLCDQLEVGNRTEVYRFSVQLFPLTKL